MSNIEIIDITSYDLEEQRAEEGTVRQRNLIFRRGN